MNISHTNQIDEYLKIGYQNMQDDRLNKFIGRKVNKSTEMVIQKKLAKINYPEFQGPVDCWPSLFISTDTWKQSPYHRHIHLDGITEGGFQLKEVTLEAGCLFNSADLQPDENRQLHDWMRLRALDEPCKTLFLYQDDIPWMMDCPAESYTNDGPAAKAYGRVITFGLGIGYFAYMALQNKKVTSVTVVEKSPEVIEMFNRYLLPQFGKVNLKIIQGDAQKWFTAEKLKDFDYSYTDIWHSSDDGLAWMSRLLAQYQPPLDKVDFWIENSCLETVWSMVFLYFYDQYHQQTFKVAAEYQFLAAKVKKYFSKIDQTLTTVDQLKHYIYDRAVLRAILATE